MVAITFIVAVVILPLAILTAFFALEVFAGLAPLRELTAASVGARATIVIPANDEEAIVGATVAHLKHEAGQDFELLVVADNCTDGTAEAARSAGADVLVRDDPGHRGKGFALAAARDHLQSRQTPDVVIIMDADCRIDRRGLQALAASAVATGRACQAVYLFDPVPNGPANVQISTFAFMIKNLVRQRGLQRLARRAHLTGTGMALPWGVFASVDLGGSNIVEDLALGLDLAERNAAPLLVEGATVWSATASSEGTLVQRSRWEGGYLATALKRGPPAIVRSIVGADLRGLIAALDLCVPPLALLFVLNLAGCLLAVALALASGPAWPLMLTLGTGFAAFAALGVAWALEGRRFASGATLLRLPLYVLWKLPMYAGLVRRGAPKEWLRTGR